MSLRTGVVDRNRVNLGQTSFLSLRDDYFPIEKFKRWHGRQIVPTVAFGV
jgi:hypothetical protein